jgi:hypothetical protein
MDEREKEIHQKNRKAFEIFGQSTQILEFFLQERNQTD